MALILLGYSAAWAQQPAPEDASAPAPDTSEQAALPPSTLVPPALVESPPLQTPALVPEGGSVTLRVLIDEAGQVEQASGLSGAPSLVEEAIKLALAARFAPATEAGVPVAVELDWVMEFPPSPVAPPPETAAPPAAASPPGAADPPRTPDGLVSTYYRLPDAPTLRVISPEEVRVLPGTMGDPVRAVLSEPGLSRTPLDAGWLLVRGGAPEDTGLFIDGVRVPLVYHLGGFTSAIHPELVSQVLFMPSGFPVSFGDATAGVVNVRTRRVGLATRASASVDTLASGLFVEAPVPWVRGLGFAASARRSYLDALLGLVPGISEEQAQIAPRFLDWSARLDAARAGLFGFGYTDAIEVPADEAGETVTLLLGTARAHGRARLGPVELTPYIAREWSTISALEVQDERDTRRVGGRVELPDHGRSELALSGGLEGEYGSFGMEVNDVPVGGTFGSVEPYAALRFGLRRQLTLGARLETLFVDGQLPRLAPDARLGATFPVNDHLGLVADLGLYSAQPALDYLFALPAGEYLPMSQSAGGGAGLRLEVGPARLELDGWGRGLDRIAAVEDDGSLGLARGAAWGVESLVTAELGAFSARLLYSWSRSVRQAEPGRPWEPYVYDQPHSLNTTLVWSAPKGWALAGRLRISSGYLRGEATQAYDILRSEVVELDTSEDRLEPFYALDLKVSRPFEAARWSLQGYLDVQNVTNHRIAEPAITGIRYQASMLTYGLPVLPIFGVEGRFSKN